MPLLQRQAAAFLRALQVLYTSCARVRQVSATRGLARRYEQITSPSVSEQVSLRVRKAREPTASQKCQEPKPHTDTQ